MLTQRTTYQMLSIRLNLLKSDCLQALNHARALEFSQDSDAVAGAYRQFSLVQQFVKDLMNDCPDDLPAGDPLVVETMELLNNMGRQVRRIRRK